MKSYRKLRALARNLLIGLEARVVRSSEKSLEGMKGKIVDETLNTLVLQTKNGEKRIAKDKVVVEISFPEGTYTFSGKEIKQRPDERLKKLWRKIR